MDQNRDLQHQDTQDDSIEAADDSEFDEVQDSEARDDHRENLPELVPGSKKRRESKFAQVLGFGRYRGEASTPVNMGNIEVSDDEVLTPNRFGNTPLEPSFYQIGLRMADTQWAMNYQEASIYLEEGVNNDAFSTHPKRKESLPAYILAHTSWFYILDLSASLLLLILAVAEPPAIDILQVPIAIHASLELGALAVLIFELVLKMRWLGWKTLFNHHRTTLKAITLLVMVVEAITVLVRQSSHFRVTRALRPIFLVDNKYFSGVRRFVRQVIQSLPPILDMMLLLFFFLFVFTLLGHFLFGTDTDDPFFSSVDDSFVNLFVLLTTANYPDVMMPAYARNPWSVLFFVAYLVTVLYLFMNLLLAVVYDTFTSLEKEKFRKLVIHRRQACHYAFGLLVSKSNQNGIVFRHFYGLMTQYMPQKSLRDIYLTFRALNKASDGVVSREEFCRFYEVAGLKWKPVSPEFQKRWPILPELGTQAQRFLNSHYSDPIFNALIVLNTVAMLLRYVQGQTKLASWDAYIFSLLFSFEMGIKICTWGFPRIISSGWHTFDLTSSILFVITIVLVKFVPQWEELMTFIRPLRLLRLFKLKKRYRDVFGTVFILIPPMTSASAVILLMYYFYSIVGMELFAGTPLKNCCNGTMLESYYEDVGNQSTFALRYYLNNFENLFSSTVTLFELTVVNNWYVIMEGHVQVTSKYSRIYFMSFYLVTMVLLTVIVAKILDAFLFRIQYKHTMDKKTENRMLRKEVKLSAEEIDFCYRHFTDDNRRRRLMLEDYGEDLANKGFILYVGFRQRTKEILYKRLYRDEMPNWLAEAEPILRT